MKLNKVRVERVLSIPEKAVIDTGTKYVVYVESSPGVYDSRAVKLGPRTGEYYPVIEGLKLGDRIVSRGSFLIDAEARLNPTATGPEAKQTGEHQHGG
jgi:Cu(I)/Ag(I) efflux system membrane fusion protein